MIICNITSQASGTHSLLPVCDTSPAPATPGAHTSTAAATDLCARLSLLDILHFTQAVGPTVIIPDSPDLFFTEEIYSLIVEDYGFGREIWRMG